MIRILYVASNYQGGGIPIYSVLQSSSSVKVDQKNYPGMALHLLYHCGFYRWNFAWPWPFWLYTWKRYSGLTIDYGEYFKLTFILTEDEDRSTEYIGMLAPLELLTVLVERLNFLLPTTLFVKNKSGTLQIRTIHFI